MFRCRGLRPISSPSTNINKIDFCRGFIYICYLSKMWGRTWTKFSWIYVASMCETLFKFWKHKLCRFDHLIGLQSKDRLVLIMLVPLFPWFLRLDDKVNPLLGLACTAPYPVSSGKKKKKKHRNLRYHCRACLCHTLFYKFKLFQIATHQIDQNMQPN